MPTGSPESQTRSTVYKASSSFGYPCMQKTASRAVFLHRKLRFYRLIDQNRELSRALYHIRIAKWTDGTFFKREVLSHPTGAALFAAQPDGCFLNGDRIRFPVQLTASSLASC